ncbi:hypothetical protein OUZ56_007651 [Daphnia magna]|uniref:Uncharacterized protein n=1 Tax=Daphnia magna TaxID=35525 RepID=A0ABR0AAL0_9CRUS|nr:hypothetical protein OUZ56_007651 [Daphnia magna]
MEWQGLTRVVLGGRRLLTTSLRDSTNIILFACLSFLLHPAAPPTHPTFTALAGASPPARCNQSSGVRVFRQPPRAPIDRDVFGNALWHSSEDDKSSLSYLMLPWLQDPQFFILYTRARSISIYIRTAHTRELMFLHNPVSLTCCFA